MIQTQGMPVIYRACRNSKFRRKIAAMGMPLSEKTQKGLEMARAFRAAYLEKTGIYTDLEAFKDQISKFLESGIGLFDFNDVKNLSYPESMQRIFDNNGVFFEPRHKSILAGRLFDSWDVSGVRVILAAAEGGDELASIYVPGNEDVRGPEFPPGVVLDARVLLERTVARINLFRYHEAEQLSFVALNSRERASPTMPMVKKRISAIVPHGKLKENAFQAVVRKMMDNPNDSLELTQVLPKILAIRYPGRLVRTTYIQDDIQHTIDLFNLMARSTLITQLAYHAERGRDEKAGKIQGSIEERTKGNEDYKKMLTEHLSWLADTAYGNPFFRIGEVQLTSAMGSNTPSMFFFAQEGMSRILRSLNLASDSYDKLSKYHKLLTIKAERLMQAAAHVLDEAYLDHTGKDYFGNFPELKDAFEAVKRTEFMTRENLPEIAQFWKEQYGPEE